MEVSKEVLEKWSVLIEAAKKYWVTSEPTGMTDAEFDAMEIQAYKEDGFYARDYVLQTYSVGKKTKNQWIDKITKFKIEGSTMLDAMKKSADELGIPYDKLYVDLKYDGSSIAIYINPNTGKPHHIVTVGNLNLDNFGVDQTWKLINLIPKQFPLGIKAIQCEALIDLDRFNGDPDRARQKANGLINSKYADDEVASLLTLRAYRYYWDETTMGAKWNMTKDYKTVLSSFQAVLSKVDGHVQFCRAKTWTLQEIIYNNLGDKFESDKIETDTGTFLADGVCLYNEAGVCQRALKFAGAGSGTELIKSTVQSIQWNDQTPKGKDSWSANVLIDPVTIKGCVIKKPSAGSVAKLIKNNITPGAEVSIILANSTIPMIGESFSVGNGDYNWPTCACGYKMGPNDIYGSLLKCGNPMCTERIGRMRAYVDSLADVNSDLDLNTLLVIDRFRWENTTLDKSVLLGYVKAGDEVGYKDYLMSFLKTDLQKRNMELVWKASYIVLHDKI